jgi:hypothetical protein
MGYHNKSSLPAQSQSIPFGPGGGITGRDGYLARQALAYAIECIGHLPKRWQEYSNQQDMIALLDAVAPRGFAEILRSGARAHIECRGSEKAFTVGPINASTA